MIFRVTDYIIDYERINELTSHKNDDPKGGIAGAYVMGARSTVKKYLKTFEEQMVRGSNREKEIEIKSPAMKHMINTLIYNRVLIHIDAERRENALEQLLDD
jgi:hypothetical protein